MKKTVHIISHTHWDREWYLNSKFVNQWIPVFFESLFHMLEKEPEYRFALDGQTSILDDCYAELEKNGCRVEEFRHKLRKYVKEGRIILGPYYLQPDWQLISGEALIRNMLYGKEMSEEYEGGTSTGWLLDNFGQISQAPQIHQQFGMKGIVVWRGVEFEPEHLNSEFYWESPDGTVMPCVYLLGSYRNAMRLADNPESIYGRIRNEAQKIEPFATTGNVLLMNGYDQEMNPDDIIPYIKDGKADFDSFQVKQSTPDEYIGAVIQELKNVRTFSGALYSGRYISVFPGVLSSRMYLKLKNDFIQRKMEYYAEPLSVMGSFLGADYPKENLDAAWKLLLKNHPHDSICGVSVDDVHTDMEDRFEEVQSELDQCINLAVGQLVSAADTSAFVNAKALFQVYNTVPKNRVCNVFLPYETECSCEVKDETGKSYQSQKVEQGLLVKALLPAFGYCTLGVYDSQNHQDTLHGQDPFPVMENEWITVEFHQNGTFCLKDKLSNKTYKNMGYLEDCADSGDEYNFSYIAGEEPKTTLNETAVITLIENGSLRTVVKIQYQWKLPRKLSSKRNRRETEEEIIPITTFVTLEQDSPILHFRTLLRNRCKDHRIRVLFPTEIHTEESFAQTQFDVSRHPIVPVPFDNSKIPENVSRIIIGARESQPITQFPQKDFVAVSDGIYGAAVLNQGLPEYEVLPEKTTIALTLFRSVGWLARTDLNTRIGDAGPEIFTPDAQCLRDMEFNYAFYPFSGSVEAARLLEKSTDMNQPAIAVRTKPHDGVLPPRNSFFSMDASGDIKVTGIKGAQDKKGMIIRFFHAGQEKEQVIITVSNLFEEAFEVNMAEEESEKLPIKNGSLSIFAQPKKIITLRLAFKTNLCDTDYNIEKLNICFPVGYQEDFSQYNFPEIVTEEEVHQEEIRAKETMENYRHQYECFHVQKQKIKDKTSSLHEKKELEDLKMQVAALHRAELEAGLSSIFTWKKRKESLCKRNSEAFAKISMELESQIKDFADQLNLARIEKRVCEYRADFYTKLEKEEAIENRSDK